MILVLLTVKYVQPLNIGLKLFFLTNSKPYALENNI